MRERRRSSGELSRSAHHRVHEFPSGSGSRLTGVNVPATIDGQVGIWNVVRYETASGRTEEPRKGSINDESGEVGRECPITGSAGP